MNDNKARDELKLTHLKDFRAVLRWSYDHGLLKGEFPTSDSGGKPYILDQGEKRLMQLIDAYVDSRVLEEAKKYCDDGHYHDEKRDIAMLTSERLAEITDNQEKIDVAM